MSASPTTHADSTAREIAYVAVFAALIVALPAWGQEATPAVDAPAMEAPAATADAAAETARKTFEEGALADLLLVDGDPTVDISLVARPEQSLKVIMKDGVVYKDTL